MTKAYPYYIYSGDKFTCPDLKGQRCTAIRRPDGKCIRGRNSNMAVVFDNGEQAVVLARRLRKINPET